MMARPLKRKEHMSKAMKTASKRNEERRLARKDEQ